MPQAAGSGFIEQIFASWRSRRQKDKLFGCAIVCLHGVLVKGLITAWLGVLQNHLKWLRMIHTDALSWRCWKVPYNTIQMNDVD
jgi:hypothetical protein